jgi:transcriptional regulator with XRE-family HTH domain
MENNTTTAEQLGKEISIVRNKRGFRQQTFGSMLNSGQSFVSQIEKGQLNLTLETVDKIASLLSCKVEIKLRRIKKQKAE